MSINLTWNDLIEKFGNYKLQFDSYYKYRFCFSGGQRNGISINAEYGGDAGDIYKFSVENKLYSLSEILWDNVTVQDGDTYYYYEWGVTDGNRR